MRKTFFIVPGFKQTPTDKSFDWLKKYLTEKEYRVVIVPIQWDRRLMSDYVQDVQTFYENNKTETNYILGFSFGAVATLVAANKLQPKKIFLCSLSPDFKEDIHTLKPWIKKYIGKKRLKEMEEKSAQQIARDLLVPSVVLYGETEGKQYPQLKIRSEETAHLAPDSKLVVVKEALHDMSHPHYQKAIITEIDCLDAL